MKSLIFPFLLLIIIQASAQNARVGFNAGVNFSTLVFKSVDENPKLSYKPGIALGMLLDIPVTSAFSVQPALNYVTKGAKFPLEKTNINLNYFEVPLNLLYYSKSSIGKFFIGGGPYIAGPIMSNVIIDTNNVKHREEIEFGKTENSDFRSFDWGVNGTTGILFKNGFQVSAFFSRGLYNLNPSREDGAGKGYNQSFGIKLGYLCGSISGR
ncbi:MAG: porin family protein [Ferruginibacter sp.]